MIYLETNINLADLFNISAEEYKYERIEELPLTVRQHNALLAAGCYTMEQLLNMTINDLYGIKNLGRTSIDGIIDYIEKNYGEEAMPSFTENEKLDINSLRKHTREILAGRFEEISDIEIDISALEKCRNAYRETEHELLEKCVQEPAKVIPYISMLSHWVDYREYIKQVVIHIPEYRLKNKAIGYINAYININREWNYTLPDNFDENETLETFLMLGRTNNRKETENLINWCTKDIREISDEFVIEIEKKERTYQVVKSRMEKKTLDEVGAFFGVTRERIRQIEKKAKIKAGAWAKRSNILRLMSADLNNKTVMSAEDFSKLLGANGTLIFYLLADNDEAEIEGIVYDKVYKVFVFGEDLDFTAEEQLVDELPAIFPKEDYEKLISEASEGKEGISEDQLRLVIDSEYDFKDGFYRSKHEKVSLTAVYREVLKKHFNDGIRLHIDSEINLFKEYVQKDYGIDISSKSNRSVEAILGRVGIVCDRGTVCPKQDSYVSSQLREKIRRYILDKKDPLIFINSIYSVFEEDLESSGINNRYFLQGVLKEEFSNEFYITRDYISREPVTDTIYTSVVEYIKKFSYPISKEQIFKEFPGLTEIMLNFSTTNDTGVINYFGQYMHLDKLKLFDFDREYLNETIEKILSDGKPHHDEEVFSYLIADNPNLLKRIYVTFPYSCFSFLQSIYTNNYQFARPYIARNDVEIGNPYEQIKEYVIGEDCIDIEDVLGIAKELHYQVNSILEFLKSFSATHVLINNEQIATFNYIGINPQVYEELEVTIANEVQETVPIRELKCLHQLKKLNVPWTDWLIYSIVDKYGKRLETDVSNNQFRFAVPLISPKGQMNVKKYTQLKTESSGTFRVADNLDNIDDLIANLIDEEIEGDIW